MLHPPGTRCTPEVQGDYRKSSETCKEPCKLQLPGGRECGPAGVPTYNIETTSCPAATLTTTTPSQYDHYPLGVDRPPVNQMNQTNQTARQTINHQTKFWQSDKNQTPKPKHVLTRPILGLKKYIFFLKIYNVPRKKLGCWVFLLFFALFGTALWLGHHNRGKHTKCAFNRFKSQ